jgi:hypothetical protein
MFQGTATKPPKLCVVGSIPAPPAKKEIVMDLSVEEVFEWFDNCDGEDLEQLGRLIGKKYHLPLDAYLSIVVPLTEGILQEAKR